MTQMRLVGPFRVYPSSVDPLTLVVALFAQEDFDIAGEISKGSFGTVFKAVRKCESLLHGGTAMGDASLLIWPLFMMQRMEGCLH